MLHTVSGLCNAVGTGADNQKLPANRQSGDVYTEATERCPVDQWRTEGGVKNC